MPEKKRRDLQEGQPLFVHALVAVQQHNWVKKAAVSGFLRDDGTAVCKRLDWKANELALYKIVLLNLTELKRLGVEYQQDLKMYEDICLNHDVLRNGGKTLKCQCYCFRASHNKRGGCEEQRAHGSSGQFTQLHDLIAPQAYARLVRKQQVGIGELLEWVRDKEAKFGGKASPDNI